MKAEGQISDGRCFRGMPAFSPEQVRLMELGYDTLRAKAVQRLADSVTGAAVTIIKGRADYDQTFLGLSTLQKLKQLNRIGGACVVSVNSQDFPNTAKTDTTVKDNSNFGPFWSVVRESVLDTTPAKIVKDHGLAFLRDVGRVLPAKEKKIFVVMVEDADDLVAYNFLRLKKRIQKLKITDPAAKGDNKGDGGPMIRPELPDEDPSPFLKELERLTREADGTHIHFLLCCSSGMVKDSLYNSSNFRRNLLKVHTEEGTEEAGGGLFSELSSEDQLLDFYRSVREKAIASAEAEEEATGGDLAEDGGGGRVIIAVEMLPDEILKKIVESSKGSAEFIQTWAKLVASRPQKDIERYIKEFEAARQGNISKSGTKKKGARTCSWHAPKAALFRCCTSE